MDGVQRQLRAAELEAKFSVLVTLAVCVRVEWPHPNGVAMAVVLPLAMAFSVHGLHNAAGLRRWNLVYVPLRLVIVIAGLAYSYSHYYEVLVGPVPVAGYDIRWLVALTVELLTISALVAHQGHSTRLVDRRSEAAPEAIDEQVAVAGPDPGFGEAGASLGVPLQVRHRTPVLNGAGS